ncbi:MAG: hypothetical protein AAB770_01210 [Patescibacteria group bacterium]
MLHIIYGKDREKGRARFRELQGELSKKCGEERIVLEGEVDEDFLAAASSVQGLFNGVTLFTFDCVFDKKVEREMLLSHASNFVSSPNSFLIFEPALEKNIADSLKEAGAEALEYAAKNIDTRPDFNIFSLGDALGQRNKKELWVLYQEARVADLTPEEICSTLFWAVKNIALLKNAKSGEDKGVSPFVAKKTRVFAKNYTQEEIANMSRSLVTAYHEAHRGGEPMDIALERFILSL